MIKTFIYLCRSGQNEELRYSLRSIDTFYPDAIVWVVGGKPDWYTGNFIAVKQTSDAFQNVKDGLASIINHPDIPDEVIIMNDDFFFIQKLDEIPVYISGTLEKRIMLHKKNRVGSMYVNKLVQLVRHCKQYRNPPLDFDIHVPMPINKHNLPWVINDHVMWRSNYGNRFVKEEDVRVIEDVKVYADKRYAFKSYDYLSYKYPFVSTHDDSFQEVYDVLLKNLFPNESKYELPIFSGS